MRMKCIAVLFLVVGLSLALPVEKQARAQYDVERALTEMLLDQALSQGEVQSHTAQAQLNVENIIQNVLARSPFLQRLLERSPVLRCIFENLKGNLTPENIRQLVNTIRSGDFLQVFRIIPQIREQILTCVAQARDGQLTGEIQQENILNFPVVRCIVENLGGSLTLETILNSIRSGEFIQNVFPKIRNCIAQARGGGLTGKTQQNFENIIQAVQRILQKSPVLSCIFENIRSSLTPQAIQELFSRIRSGEFLQVVREIGPQIKQQVRSCIAQARGGGLIGETQQNFGNIIQVIERSPVLSCVFENIRSSLTPQTIQELFSRIRSGDFLQVVREIGPQIKQQVRSCVAQARGGGLTGGRPLSHHAVQTQWKVTQLAEMMDNDEVREQVIPIIGCLLADTAREYGQCIISRAPGQVPNDLIDRLVNRDFDVLRDLGNSALSVARQCAEENSRIGPLFSFISQFF